MGEYNLFTDDPDVDEQYLSDDYKDADPVFEDSDSGDEPLLHRVLAGGKTKAEIEADALFASQYAQMQEGVPGEIPEPADIYEQLGAKMGKSQNLTRDIDEMMALLRGAEDERRVAASPVEEVEELSPYETMPSSVFRELAAHIASGGTEQSFKVAQARGGRS